MNDLEIHNTALNIQAKCWKLFLYVPDEINYLKEEHWASHAEEVNQNKTFEDDCDGFALTCAELLIEAGVPRDKVSVVYCVTETNEGHLVCGVETNNTTMILDNRYRKVYDWQERNDYDWILFMKFSERGVWRKVI